MKTQENKDFGTLLDEFMAGKPNFEGTVVRGTIVSIDQNKEVIVVDIGLKSEGRVSFKEVMGRLTEKVPAVGDHVDVYVEKLEDRNGEPILSVEKARKEAAWCELEKALESGVNVEGVIFGRVKGGYAVDLGGPIAFLPGSQVDLRPIRDSAPLLNVMQPFKILKMDRLRNNIVVSRRSVMEETRAEARGDLISRLEEGQVMSGIVKNITDYGAFVDLGGVDGLLHVTDISWRRVHHPSEILQTGETINVMVLKFNQETGRISLGVKQLEGDPWKSIESRYTPGQRLTGKVTNITDYGAFVELESAIEGLIHVSELSWTKKNIHPNKVLELGQEIEVVVLDVDGSKRRVSLGYKQCQDNPWEHVKGTYPIGSTLEGTIRNITEFGMFVSVTDDLDGMVHLTDISWDMPGDVAVQDYSKGQKIQVKVLDIDPSKERISLGIRQLGSDTFSEGVAHLKKGDSVQCLIESVTDRGLDVLIKDHKLHGFIKKNDLGRDRSDHKTNAFSVGHQLEAKISQIDTKNRKIYLSIRALELEEEKEALSGISTTEHSQSSLGDALGAAMKKASETPYV